LSKDNGVEQMIAEMKSFVNSPDYVKNLLIFSREWFFLP